MKLVLVFLSLLLSVSSNAEVLRRFVTLKPSDFNISKEVTTIKNLPRQKSQDSLGICYAMSANVVLEHYLCEINKKDCGNLKPHEEISPLSTVLYTRTDRPGLYPGEVTSHNSLFLNEGGVGSIALNNMARLKVLYADSCFPFDQIVRRHGNDEDSMNAALKKLEETYRKAKATEASACIECLQKDFNNAFGSNVSSELIKDALQARTFPAFLFNGTFNSQDCEQFVEFNERNKPLVTTYPGFEKTATYPEKMTFIKDVLKSGRPLELGGICLLPAPKGAKYLCEAHSVAITGYRKQCADTGECREVVRLQNSWGQEWQDKFQDGWVDAKTLLDNTDHHQLTYLRHKKDKPIAPPGGEKNL